MTTTPDPVDRAKMLATAKAFRCFLDGDNDGATIHLLNLGHLKGTGCNAEGIAHWLKEAGRIAQRPAPTHAEVVAILERLRALGLTRQGPPLPN